MDETNANAAVAAIADLMGAITGSRRWLDDPDTSDTPRRVAQMYKELLTPKPFEFTTFPNPGYDQIILEMKIPFISLCAHHLVPFIGHAHVAYIPDKKIAGLSKLARTVETMARALQIQERMTQEIGKTIKHHLTPIGTAVIIEAQHLCMHMRGVKKAGIITKTSWMDGAFRDKPEAREELMFLLQMQGGT